MLSLGLIFITPRHLDLFYILHLSAAQKLRCGGSFVRKLVLKIMHALIFTGCRTIFIIRKGPVLKLNRQGSMQRQGQDMSMVFQSLRIFWMTNNQINKNENQHYQIMNIFLNWKFRNQSWLNPITYNRHFVRIFFSKFIIHLR